MLHAFKHASLDFQIATVSCLKASEHSLDLLQALLATYGGPSAQVAQEFIARWLQLAITPRNFHPEERSPDAHPKPDSSTAGHADTFLVRSARHQRHA